MDQSIAGLTGIDAYIARMQALKQIPSLDSVSNERLAQMPADEIAHLRNVMFTDQASQDRIAPYEHRAWAREMVANNPLWALPMSVFPAGYYASKVATNGWGSRTGASMEQVKQGMMGNAEGLMSGIRGLMQ